MGVSNTKKDEVNSMTRKYSYNRNQSYNNALCLQALSQQTWLESIARAQQTHGIEYFNSFNIFSSNFDILVKL